MGTLLKPCLGIAHARVEQREGSRGSLKWIQRLVDSNPNALNEDLRSAGALPSENHLKWLAPLRTDGWAEYRDALDDYGRGNDGIRHQASQECCQRRPSDQTPGGEAEAGANGEKAQANESTIMSGVQTEQPHQRSATAPK
jgi:hypothetical protein